MHKIHGVHNPQVELEVFNSRRFVVDNSGAPGGTRTPNPLIRSQMLYPLSYGRSTSQDISQTSRTKVPEMGLLDNKVAVVTGAGSGLGREYAIALAQQGASVVVNDYGANVLGQHAGLQSADEVAQRIVANGGHAVANTASVADWNGAQSIIDDAVTNFGRCDIVVNNAGNNRPSSLVDLSEEDIDSHLDVHLKGTLAVSHFAAAYWNTIGAEPHRAIVNTTSSVGLHPTIGGGVYSLSLIHI